MPVENNLPPYPVSMLRIGDTILVVLQFWNAGFTAIGEGAIVGVKSGAIAWEIHTTGLVNCDHPTLSPSGQTMALACQGQLQSSGVVMDQTKSGIQLYDVTSLPPQPKKLYPVYDQLGSTVQSGVTWASETLILGKTQTPYCGPGSNEAFTLDLTTGKATALLTATKSGLVYGEVLCRPGCSDVCMLANMDDGKIDRWQITAQGLSPLSSIEVDSTTGLPPSLLGGY